MQSRGNFSTLPPQMQLILLKSKIHGATVTAAELEYEGSLTIDRNLMDAVRILPYEKILVANLSNGKRFETYAIPGPPASGTICLNGAAARKGKAGDRLIVFAFCVLSEEEARRHRPLIQVVDAQNRPAGALRDI